MRSQSYSAPSRGGGVGICLSSVLVLLVGLSPAIAQTSTSYKQEEHTFNQGGHPEGGVVLTSTSYKITLDAIGDSISGVALLSSSYKLDGGFPASYAAPGEVMSLLLAGTGLSWDVEPSRGDYSVYRGLVSGLPGGYGTVFQTDITTESTNDAALPGAGEAYFYLITVDNRLAEEGTKGFDSSGTER